VINLQRRSILAVSLLISQSLLVVPLAQANDSNDEDFGPIPLQGMVSAKAPRAPLEGNSMIATPSTPGHFLYGGVEQKVKAPLPASVEEIRLTKQTAKLAPLPIQIPIQNQVHNLSAQDNVLANNQVWFRIPAWLAGKWKTQDKQLIGEINYRTGKQTPPQQLSFGYCGEEYGLQQDKNGTCWQFEKVGSQPINYKVDKNGMAHFDVVESNHPVSSSNAQLVLQKIWMNVTMNPDTQEIVGERRCQSILTFNRLDDQSISVNDATETFDRQGTPVSMRLTQTARVKVAPFQPVDNVKGDDMRTLFSQYMNIHGMSNLLASKNVGTKSVGAKNEFEVELPEF